MKRDHRYLLLAIALVLLPLVGITAAQIFPIFDPPLLPFFQPTVNRGPRSLACPPGQPCPLPRPTPGARPPADRRPLLPIPDPWTNTADAPCKPGEKCPGHPIRRPLVPIEPVEPVEPPPTYVPSVSVEVGEVLTVGPNEPASVTIREAGTGRYLLTFSIPRGRDGRDGERGDQGRVGDTGLTGDTPTINVEAIAREAAKELPAFFWVRRLDVATGEERLERIPLGEGFTILNFPPE